MRYLDSGFHQYRGNSAVQPLNAGFQKNTKKGIFSFIIYLFLFFRASDFSLELIILFILLSYYILIKKFVQVRSIVLPGYTWS